MRNNIVFISRNSLEFIQVGDENIQPKSSAGNLGVIIDQCLDLTDHVKKKKKKSVLPAIIS